MTATGTLYVGTSGFGYPAWAPRFYPAGSRPGDLLRLYSERLDACELNGTFYRQPSRELVATWARSVPPRFRFAVKAQRGGAIRALVDPAGTIPWLTEPYAAFGERLGSILLRVPEQAKRTGVGDDERLAAFLARWPSVLPLTVEFQHASWHVDEVFELLRSAGAATCATELDEDPEPPRLRLSGPFLYVRLRREGYAPAELAEWADRLAPFLADGRDVYVFFRHDDAGVAAERAMGLRDLVGRALGASDAPPSGPPRARVSIQPG